MNVLFEPTELEILYEETEKRYGDENATYEQKILKIPLNSLNHMDFILDSKTVTEDSE